MNIPPLKIIKPGQPWPKKYSKSTTQKGIIYVYAVTLVLDNLEDAIVINEKVPRLAKIAR